MELITIFPGSMAIYSCPLCDNSTDQKFHDVYSILPHHRILRLGSGMWHLTDQREGA